MSFSRVRTAGLWLDGTTVAGSELEQLDANLANALDMQDGGAYSPQGNIAIGGAPGVYWRFDLGVEFYGNIGMFGSFEAFGNVGLYGNTTIGSGPGDFLSVQCPATFDSFATFNAFATFDEQALFNEGFNVAFGKFCNFDGAFFDGEVTFGDAVIFQDQVDFNLSTTFGDQATFYEQVVFQKIILLTGEARIPQRQAIGGDANATYNAKSYTHVHVPDGTLSAIRYYTIGDTGAQDGDRMRFSTRDSGFDVGIKSPGGSLITSINAGTQRWVDMERIQGEWIEFKGNT